MEPTQKQVAAFWIAILAIFFALAAWSLSEDSKSKCKFGSYQVRPGDTLNGIALQFCDGNIAVAVLDIKEYNGITDPSNLRIGQIIVIPAS
jgi:LysM repeat protein